jgi:hypothetical protein
MVKLEPKFFGINARIVSGPSRDDMASLLFRTFTEKEPLKVKFEILMTMLKTLHVARSMSVIITAISIDDADGFYSGFTADAEVADDEDGMFDVSIYYRFEKDSGEFKDHGLFTARALADSEIEIRRARG